MKKFIGFILLAVLFTGCSFDDGGVLGLGGGVDETKSYVVVDGQKFAVEIMRTDAQRKKGLMGREGLADHEGMIFLFEQPGPLSFWMKNMKFPIDMVFIDQHKKIMNVARDVPPCKQDPCALYKSNGDGQYVLEIDAGLSDKYGFEPGDSIEFKNFN